MRSSSVQGNNRGWLGGVRVLLLLFFTELIKQRVLYNGMWVNRLALFLGDDGPFRIEYVERTKIIRIKIEFCCTDQNCRQLFRRLFFFYWYVNSWSVTKLRNLYFSLLKKKKKMTILSEGFLSRTVTNHLLWTTCKWRNLKNKFVHHIPKQRSGGFNMIIFVVSKVQVYRYLVR